MENRFPRNFSYVHTTLILSRFRQDQKYTLIYLSSCVSFFFCIFLFSLLFLSDIFKIFIRKFKEYFVTFHSCKTRRMEMKKKKWINRTVEKIVENSLGGIFFFSMQWKREKKRKQKEKKTKKKTWDSQRSSSLSIQ